MLLLLGCIGAMDDWPAPTEVPAGDEVVPLPGDVVVPETDTGQARGVPAACPEDIFVAQAGNSGDVPVLADAHADVVGAAPAPSGLHLSWPGDPSSTIAAVWRTDAETMATRIELGPAPGRYSAAVDGRSFVLEGDTAMGRVHEVRVCGLLPGTTWYYRVGGEGGWSDEASFTTGPAVDDEGVFVFAVAGDTRGDPTTWKQVLTAMVERGAEFVVFTGDAVNTGNQTSEWDAWLAAGEGIFPSLPLLIAHGNHEGMAQQYFALFSLPGNEQWFSYDYGNVHFTFVNDTPNGASAWEEQAEWLTTDLAGHGRHWSFLVHHKPAFSSSSVHAEDIEVLDRIVPIAESKGVDLDLAGHNHHYERSVPLRQGALNTTAGIVYVVTAGGGAPLYGNDGHQWYTDAVSVTENFVIVRVQGDIVTIIAYDLAGNILDTYAFQR